jgi:hypothetical protein
MGEKATGKKAMLRIRVFIPNAGSDFFPSQIPDHGSRVKKIPDPGSGSKN